MHLPFFEVPLICTCIFMQIYYGIVYCILRLYTTCMFVCVGCYNTYDLAERNEKNEIQVVGRSDNAVFIQGVWLDIPAIETVLVSAIGA